MPGGYRSTRARAQDGRTGGAKPAPHTAEGEQHGGLYHWSPSVGTSGDGLVRGISPEDGRPDRQTRRQGIDRGQRSAGPDGPGRGSEAPRSIVIVEFPSRALAHAFHNDPDYAPLQQLRQANIDLEVFVVEPV